MSDLHKRLAHWKRMSQPASNTLEGVDPLWLEQERADLALDALAKAAAWIDEVNAHFGPCDHSVGICQCADLRMADEFRNILRELRGATSGEGGGL